MSTRYSHTVSTLIHGESSSVYHKSEAQNTNNYICNSLISSICYGQDDSGFESQQPQEGFLFSETPRPVLGPIQPPIQWVT